MATSTGRGARRGLGAALVGLLCLLGGASPALAGRRDAVKTEETPGPAVRLLVSPRHGFRPLTITLSGSLTGIRPDDPEYCHPGVEWEGRTFDGRLTSSKQDATCVHAPDTLEVPLSFSKVITLTEAGSYQYRLILHLKSGARLLSNVQEVRVLDNP